MSILFNDSGDFRSVCRFSIYIAVFTLFLFANGALLSVMFGSLLENSEVGFLGINALGLLIPTVATLLFMIRFVDRMPLQTFGTCLHEKWGRDLILGLLISSIMLLSLNLLGTVVSSINIELTDHPDGFWVNLVLIIAILAISAANEELVFRGYPLQVLMAGIGAWPAIIFMSLLFGLLHHLNPGATWLGTANTFLAGILLSVAYMRTRSLWFPYGIHIGWNLFIGPISGYAVSGIQISSIWKTELFGADWLTGGIYGPEGGLLGTTIMAITIVGVFVVKHVEISPTLRNLLLDHSSKVYTKDVCDSNPDALNAV